MKNKNAPVIAGMAVAVILAAVSRFILPETVAVQMDFHGELSGAMPRPAAILIPAAMSLLGGTIGLCAKGPDRKKGIALLCIGIAIMLLTLLFNPIR